MSETEGGWYRRTIQRGRKRKNRSPLVRRSSRRVTPAGYLSGVSLHPTFTDTMLLRSPLRHPLSSSASSRACHQEDVLEDPRNRLSFVDRGCSISSFALLAIDLSCWQTIRLQSERCIPWTGSIVTVSTQQESMSAREDRGPRCHHHVCLNDLWTLQSLLLFISELQYCVLTHLPLYYYVP